MTQKIIVGGIQSIKTIDKPSGIGYIIDIKGGNLKKQRETELGALVRKLSKKSEASAKAREIVRDKVINHIGQALSESVKLPEAIVRAAECLKLPEATVRIMWSEYQLSKLHTRTYREPRND